MRVHLCKGLICDIIIGINPYYLILLYETLKNTKYSSTAKWCDFTATL